MSVVEGFEPNSSPGLAGALTTAPDDPCPTNGLEIIFFAPYTQNQP